MSTPQLDIEALADALTERGWIPPGTDLLTVRQVAGWLNVGTRWVYDHAAELEGVPLGEASSRPTLRFRRAKVQDYIDRQTLGTDDVEPVRQAPRQRRATSDVPLLDFTPKGGVGSPKTRTGGAGDAAGQGRREESPHA